MTTKEILERICEDEPCCKKYCLLKEMIAHDAKFNPRFLVQMKLVEMYKWQRGEEENKDIGFQKAWEEWVEKGYAKMFSKIYYEYKPIKQLYREVMNGK